MEAGEERFREKMRDKEKIISGCNKKQPNKNFSSRLEHK